MADISGFAPPTDFGNLLTSFGKGLADTNATNANATNTAAQTGLVQQQTQGAALANQGTAMQNQIMQARLPIILKALGDYRQQSDDSGESDDAPTGGNGTGKRVTPGTDGTATPVDPNNPQAASGVGNQPAEDATPDNWFDPSRVIKGMKQRYFVNPAGTPQEIAAIKNAVMADPDGKLGILEQAKQARELGVASRLAQSQSDASELYDSMAKGVLNAPEGRELDALEAISPPAAAQIRKLIPGDMDENEAARKYAEFVANQAHPYSGREVEKGDDGVYRDKVTGQALPGAQRIGISQQQMATLAEKLVQPVTVKNSDGTETQVPGFKVQFPGLTLQQAITKVADQQGLSAASPTITGAPKAEFQAQARTVASKTPQPPVVTRPSAPPAVAPGAPGAPPPGSPAAGQAAIQSKLLPGPDGKPLNVAALPDAVLPAVRGNSTPNPQESAAQDAFKENYKDVQSDAMRKITLSNQADTLLTPFQQKLNQVNPRDVGPGSDAYKAFLDFKTAVFGGQPQDLVDMGVLDKFANQLGVSNVRSLLSGQKITNDEMMTFLKKASASTTQPLDVMKTIVSFQKANNDFDRKYATTALTALAQHKDPVAIQSLENGREAYVAQSMARDGFGAAAPRAKPMPDDATLTAYAQQHKLPGGLAQAKAIMVKRGYK